LLFPKTLETNHNNQPVESWFSTVKNHLMKKYPINGKVQKRSKFYELHDFFEEMRHHYRFNEEQYIMHHLDHQSIKNVLHLEKPPKNTHVIQSKGVWNRRKRLRPGNKVSHWDKDCSLSRKRVKLEKPNATHTKCATIADRNYVWSRKSSLVLASVAYINKTKFSLAQEDFQTLKPGNKTNLEVVKFLLGYKCFPSESVCCYNDFDVMSGSALMNLDQRTAESLVEGKFCIFFIEAQQPKLIFVNKIKNVWMYLNPFYKENYNEQLQERVEELTCSVELKFQPINHNFLKQSQKNNEYLALFDFAEKLIQNLNNEISSLKLEGDEQLLSKRKIMADEILLIGGPPNVGPDLDYCFGCGNEDLDTKRNKKFLWIQCGIEKCRRWFHLKCAGLRTKPAEGFNYSCLMCQNL